MFFLENIVFYNFGAKRNREQLVLLTITGEPDSETLRKSLAPRQRSLSLSLSLIQECLP